MKFLFIRERLRRLQGVQEQRLCIAAAARRRCHRGERVADHRSQAELGVAFGEAHARQPCSVQAQPPPVDEEEQRDPKLENA